MARLARLFTVAIFTINTSRNLAQSVQAMPQDPSAAGPYAAGRRMINGTITSRNLTVEVWYPASLSQPGKKPLVYDIRDHLPANMAAKLPGTVYDLGAPQTCDMLPGNPPCYDGVEVDPKASKTLPLIVFVHGTGGWSGQSLQLVSHWVSRGFVVVAANYPGITLKDMLLETELHRVPKIDQVGDTKLLLATLRHEKRQPTDQWKWIIDRVNVSDIALIGHSAGAFAVGDLEHEGSVLIPMAGDGTKQSPTLKTTLILGAKYDSVVPVAKHAIPGYKRSPTPKRLAVVKNLGHHFCSDICAIGAAKGGIEKIGVSHGIWQVGLFGKLATDGCQFKDPGFSNYTHGWTFVNYATSAVLELFFYGSEAMADKLKDFQRHSDDVFLYEQDI